MRILYLCTANICRSPVAEHYMRHLVERFGLRSVEASSAGIKDMGGAPADPVMARLVKARGLDLSRHRSHVATREMLLGSDEIIVMERRHKAWIRDHFPEALKKVSLIREPEESVDLYDPVGGSVNDYRRAIEQLYACIERRALAFKYPV